MNKNTYGLPGKAFGLVAFFMVLVCSCLPAWHAAARQNNSSRWQFYRPQGTEALAHRTVSAILKDRNQFIWFGTADGLARYDGHQLVWFKNQQDNPNSLSNNIITCLAQDSHGNLLIGTQAGGLNLYSPETGQFTVYKYHPSKPQGIGSNAVWAVLEDKDGYIWCGTTGGGLNCINPATGTVVAHYTHQINDSTSLSGNNVISLFEDAQGNIWVGTELSGINMLPFAYKLKAQAPFTRYSFAAVVGNDDLHTRQVMGNRQGQMLIGTYRNGLLGLSTRAAKPWQLIADSLLVNSIALLPPKKLLIGSQSGLLEATWPAQNTQQPLQYNTLYRQQTAFVYVEDSANVWLGLQTGGIVKARLKQPFMAYKQGKGPYHLMAPKVVGMAQARNGQVWISNYPTGGYSVLDLQSGKMRHLKTDGLPNYFSTTATPRRQLNFTANSIYEDHQGHLWLGSWGHGLINLKAESHEYALFQHQPNNPNSLHNDFVRMVIEDAQHNLWIGTEQGLSYYDRQANTFTPHLQHIDPQGQLMDNRVQPSTLRQDAQGNLWFGTWGSGYVRYNPVTKQTRVWKHNPDDCESLSGNFIPTVLIDHAGTLWLGTYGNGLNRCIAVDSANNPLRFKRYNLSNGLPNETIKCIIEDRQHRLWISTNDGIVCFEPKTEVFTHYDATQNLQSSEFWQGVGLLLRDGSIMFGGDNGANRFWPDSIRLNQKQPAVRITGIKKYNRPVPFNLGTSQLTLGYRESPLTIEFAALDFTDSKKNQYRYKLEGLDEQWIDNGNRNFATYTNLDGGQYTFRVLAANNDGVWNETGATLAITVIPPFWQTWWFNLLGALLIVVGIIGVIKLRTDSFQKRNRQLRKEVAERERVQREKETLIHELQIKNTELEQFNYTVSHDLKSPLVTIRGFIGAIKKDMQQGRLDRAGKDMDMIDQAAGKMTVILDELLELSRIGRVINEPEWVGASMLATEAAGLAEGPLRTAQVQVHIPEALPTLWGDKQRLVEVFLNLIENAIKFMGSQQQPRIEVGATALSNEVLCFVKDNGTGILPEYHEKVFGLFERLDQSLPGTGIGLALVKRVVEVHGGRIWVESAGKPGQGATFFFSLPLQPETNPPQAAEQPAQPNQVTTSH